MVALSSPTGKSIRLAAIHPNAGLEAEYRRRLTKLIAEMQASLVYWLRAAYRAKPPEMAQDVSPAVALNQSFRRLSRRWQRRFDDMAPELAGYFATAVGERSDATLKAALKKGGFTVEFKLTPALNDTLQATTLENVQLIRSIASEHLTDVQGIVMRSVAAGRDLGTMTKELEARYGVTRKRAALIARTENAKATAVVTRVRQTELGITQAVWIHSSAGRHPRPSHVKAGRDGLIYNIKDGALLDGVRTWPGHEINCRCFSRPIIDALED